MREKLILRGRVINPGEAEGEALVIKRPISFLGDIDRETGRVINPELDSYGETVDGKVLVSPGGRGSTVGAWVVYGLKRRGRAPAAILLRKADTIIASGCIISDIPLIDSITPPPHEVIRTGDHVFVHRNGTIIVVRQI